MEKIVQEYLYTTWQSCTEVLLTCQPSGYPIEEVRDFFVTFSERQGEIPLWTAECHLLHQSIEITPQLNLIKLASHKISFISINPEPRGHK